MKVILGTPVRTSVKPWLYFKVLSVIISAFDLIKSNVKAEPGVNPIHWLLSFDNEVWVDSGGYQFLKHNVEYNVEHVIRIYKYFWDANYYLNLDYPPSPLDDEHTLGLKLRKSLINYEKLRRIFNDIVPVIHFHHKVNTVLKYFRKYLDYNPEVIAIGALVPYILTMRGSPKNSREIALNFLQLVREEFYNTIHVLGLGSPMITKILEDMCVNSTDSSTWRVKAAYGKVLLPGGGEIHVTNRSINFGKRKAEVQDIELLREFLYKTKFPLIDNFSNIVNSFEYRALINAWVVVYGIEIPRSKLFLKIYEKISKGVSIEKKLPNT